MADFLSTPNPCIVKAATLVEGEVFVLPPGAVLISASDPNLITSTCDIPPLETLSCYIIPLVATDADVTDSQSAWMYEAPTKIISLNVNGISYPLDIGMTTDGAFNVEEVVTFVAGTSELQGMLLDLTSNKADTNTRGGIATLCFKTIPSVATNMYLEVQTNLQDPGGYTILRGYPMLYSDFSYSGDGLCSCTLPTAS